MSVEETVAALQREYDAMPRCSFCGEVDWGAFCGSANWPCIGKQAERNKAYAEMMKIVITI